MSKMLQPLQTHKVNKAIIIIPARMGSTRLYGKPLVNINGKPMIWHVWSRAIKSNIGPVVVATDTKEIADKIIAEGGNAIITSDTHLSGSDRVFEAIEKVDSGKNYELVINLQGDIPNLNSENLKSLIPENYEFDICTFVTQAKKSEIEQQSVVKTVVAWANNKKINGKALYFSRNVVPFGAEKFWHHIGIYLWKRSSLEKFVSLPQSYLEKVENLEQLRALEFGMNIKVIKIKDAPLSVDTEDDLFKVRRLMEKNNEA